MKRFTKYANTDPYPQVQFHRDPEPFNDLINAVFAVAFIGLILWFAAKATGVDLYRVLQIVWGV